MVLGLLYGQSDKEDLESRMQANRVNEAMMERFSEKCGSYICNDLLGCDVRTEQGIQYAREHNLFTELCPRMVENAVEVLEKIISGMVENAVEVLEKIISEEKQKRDVEK